MNIHINVGAVTPRAPAMTRRLLLGGAAAGLVVGVTGCSAGSIPLISAPDPDDEVRRGVAESERLLIAAYDSAIAAAPALAGRLQGLRDQHQAHLTAVSTGLDPATLPSTSASGSPTAAATGIRNLRRLEAAAAKQRIDACAAATATDLAELLARIGASEAGHVAALSGGVG